MEDSTPAAQQLLHAVLVCNARLDRYYEWLHEQRAAIVALVLWSLVNTVATLCVIVWICTRR